MIFVLVGARSFLHEAESKPAIWMWSLVQTQGLLRSSFLAKIWQRQGKIWKGEVFQGLKFTEPINWNHIPQEVATCHFCLLEVRRKQVTVKARWSKPIILIYINHRGPSFRVIHIHADSCWSSVFWYWWHVALKMLSDLTNLVPVHSSSSSGWKHLQALGWHSGLSAWQWEALAIDRCGVDESDCLDHSWHFRRLHGLERVTERSDLVHEMLWPVSRQVWVGK